MRAPRLRYFLRLTGCAFASALFWFAVAWVLLAWRVAAGYAYRDGPPQPPVETPARYQVPYQDVTLQTEDGLRLAAWYTPPPPGVRIVLLLAHGQAARRDAWLHATAAQLTGLGVLSWDFRAHGASQGERRTFGFYEARDVLAAARFAINQPGVERVVAWGTSMGAAATLWAAARDGQAAYIHMVLADSAYADLVAIERNIIRVPGLPPFVRLFLRYMTGLHPRQMRPVDVVPRIAPRPLVLLHGVADDVTPIDQAYALYQAAGSPKVLWAFQDMGHSQAMVAQAEVYWTCLAILIRTAQQNRDFPQGVFTTAPGQRPPFCGQ